jgi:hypothetical protein
LANLDERVAKPVRSVQWEEVAMSERPDFDVDEAHRYFSGACFNKAWDFIDKPDRSAAETDEMIQLAHASAWHWTQRPDCTQDKLSISYWQLSRVYALAEDKERATRYGKLCLEASEDEAPFLVAYAHEALARAAFISGDHDGVAAHLAQARQASAKVTDRDERAMIKKDLDSIET